MITSLNREKLTRSELGLTFRRCQRIPIGQPTMRPPLIPIVLYPYKSTSSLAIRHASARVQHDGHFVVDSRKNICTSAVQSFSAVLRTASYQSWLDFYRNAITLLEGSDLSQNMAHDYIYSKQESKNSFRQRKARHIVRHGIQRTRF